jgi:hypothetical protein
MTMTSKWAVSALALTAGAGLAISGAAIAGASGAAIAGAAGASGHPGSAPSAVGPAKEPVGGRFYAVAATSSRNAWAVGLQSSNSLIMRWSGSRSEPYRWRVSYKKPVGYFLGVAATSVRNAWAVGGSNWFSPSSTVAEHWNGTKWTRFATPTPGGTGYFNAVAAISADNAWAVGLIGPGPGVPSATKPLIEHWNGTRWTTVKFPEPATGGQFSAVTATSASNVWAVGHTGATSEGNGQETLIEHWNGARWTTVPSPDPAGVGNTLAGVTATGAGNAWADGINNTGTVYQSLILHWNGTRWAVVASPSPSGDTNLTAIAAASRTNAWAVGMTNPTRCSNGGPPCETAILHWNGKAWSVTPSVNPPGSSLDVLEGVAIVSGHDAWTVGTDNYWTSTLIEHWNGTAWGWHLPR